jgi:hypothetical protein
MKRWTIRQWCVWCIWIGIVCAVLQRPIRDVGINAYLFDFLSGVASSFYVLFWLGYCEHLLPAPVDSALNSLGCCLGTFAQLVAICFSPFIYHVIKRQCSRNTT